MFQVCINRLIFCLRAVPFPPNHRIPVPLKREFSETEYPSKRLRV